jgi:hypothetical protein
VGCWAGNARWAGRADRRLAAAEMGWNSGWAKRKERERFALFFFLNSYFLLKQTNKFEFKTRLESKHPKTMQRHECNTLTTIYLI